MRCDHLEQLFPKLLAAGYEKTSDETGLPPEPGAYNCIAWAAGDIHRSWWPHKDYWWPWWGDREETISSFAKVFRWLGYRVCEGSRAEFGFEKVALYAIGGEPKHMARQLSDGTWTSKCGGLEDITHFTLDALESYGPRYLRAEYGSPVLFMRRFILISWTVRMLQWLEWRLYSHWKWN